MAKNDSMSEFELVSAPPSQTSGIPKGRKKNNSMDEFELVSAAPASAPAPSRSWTQTGIEAITNLGPSALQFAKGAVTALSQPRETLEQLGEVLTGTYARFIPQEWMARPDKAQEFIQKANAVGGVYRDRYGSVESLKNTIATDPVGFAADVSTLTGVGAAAAPGRAGQVLGTVSRVTDPMRAVTAPIAATGRVGINALGRITTGPKANVLLEAAEGRAPEIINALRQQTEIVSGATPTAGEAASPLGVTRYSALQESAERVLPSEYMARRQTQDTARADAIRQVGGTPLQLETAKKIRDATAKTNYGAAGRQLVEADDVFNGLLTRPSMDKVMARAANLAAERKQPFVIGQTRPEQTVTLPGQTGFGGMGIASAQATIPAEAAKYPVQSLHYVKMALDDLISDPKAFGIGKSEAAAISGTRAEFLNWLEGKAGAYKGARQTFAAQSGPINQMEVGQYLESKLTSALQGEEKLRPAAFAGAVEAAPQTIQKATTGAPRYQKLSDVLTPAQVKIVEDIRKDLARQAKFREQARAARPAGPNAQQAATELLIESVGGVTTPTMLNRIATVANAISKRLAGKIDRKLSIEIATEMLQPEMAALALETAQRRAANVAAGVQTAKTVGDVTRRAATPAGVISNALSQSENRNALAR
jgi:hypothetical protein